MSNWLDGPRVKITEFHSGSGWRILYSKDIAELIIGPKAPWFLWKKNQENSSYPNRPLGGRGKAVAWSKASTRAPGLFLSTACFYPIQAQHTASPSPQIYLLKILSNRLESEWFKGEITWWHFGNWIFAYREKMPKKQRVVFGVFVFFSVCVCFLLNF